MSDMTLEELQKAWQALDGVSVDADQLAEALRRHDQSFQKTIYWRDAREIGIALVLIPVWIAMGVTHSPPWTWWLGIPALVWVAAFMLVDRRRQLRGAPEPHAPLRVGLNYSLTQVEHQIWLLRNVLWWYLLPLGVPILLFFVQSAITNGRIAQSPLWQTLVAAALPVMFLFGVYGFLYRLNQHAVRTQLEPMREQLQTALLALTRDEAGET